GFLERLARRGGSQRLARLEMAGRLIEFQSGPRFFLDQQEASFALDDGRHGDDGTGQKRFTHERRMVQRYAQKEKAGRVHPAFVARYRGLTWWCPWALACLWSAFAWAHPSTPRRWPSAGRRYRPRYPTDCPG